MSTPGLQLREFPEVISVSAFQEYREQLLVVRICGTSAQIASALKSGARFLNWVS